MMVQGLIKVPVNQRTTLADYDSSLGQTDLHAYFDLSYEEQGGLVQADGNATYYFSKISQRSAIRYQFVKIPHDTKTPEAVYDFLVLEDYKVYGMCQYDGSLDYIVALHLNTNEIRVIRFATDVSNTDIVFIKDYKKVDKDDFITKLEGLIYVDCAYQGKFKDSNTYTIAISGTYFHENEISSYYLAKFSTKYNFTEFFILSEDKTVMETARGVSVDFDNKMIYLAVGINKQTYFNRTVFLPGDLPGQDNANVAIHGYSWTHGVRMWTTVIGNINYTDQFGRMKPWGNHLYVFLNSFSTQYSTNASQTDMYYYRIRATNGFVQSSQVFGSPSDDKILDLAITFNGLYILTYMNTDLLPHRDNDKQWTTQFSQPNVAVIWMGFDDKIIDIEGYAINATVSPYPMKIFVTRTIGDTQFFVFAAPRTNEQIDLNGGFFITYFSDQNAVYAQNIGCGETCRKCSPNILGKCMACKPGYFLFKNTCYQSACPDYSYNFYDTANTKLNFCQECHYSCKKCFGPGDDQCSTCCTDNICGPIYNRVPNLGKCTCPSNLIDSNGICVQRCITNLAGRLNEMCYPQCPDNSYPYINYDQVSAQERSQYDSSSQTDCQQSTYHLKFTQTGKGLPVLGPADTNQVPDEFTIGLWVRPIILNTNSFFVNAFDRIQIKAQGSTNRVFFTFKTSASTVVEPTYNNDARQRVILSNWNYIVVSQRNIKVGNYLRYEQQLAISNSNMGGMNNGGYGNTNLVVFYPAFTNTIYLGAQSDINPQSFNGYMKEFKLFTKYHNYAQIQDEQLRMYRYYSYDDPSLVAYWKLSEPYNSTDIEYTIKDYSIQMNKITYSKQSKPDYPQFIQDQSIALSLCIFHDVKVCKSPNYQQTHPYVVHPRRLTSAPTFKLLDSWSLTKAQGDQVWFLPNNTQCDFSNALAYMQYEAGFTNNWVIPNPVLSPVELLEGIHYKVCYYIASLKVSYNLYQTYIIEMPNTVDPSSGDAFMSDGVTRTWNSNGGDQGYGDSIKFSLDCNHPDDTDYEMIRNAKPSFGTHSIKAFGVAGDFYFCWQPTFIQETKDPYYQAINDLRFRIVGVPTISTASVPFVNANEDIVNYDFKGAFADGDKLAYSWRGFPISDCNPANFIGGQYSMNYNYFPGIWFGYNTGIFGITSTTNDELHMCYMSAATDAPQAWSRIKKTTGASYHVQVKEYSLPLLNGKCPELLSFSPSYGSTELTETDNTVKFTFKSQAVFPSRVQDTPTVIYGKIIIYRGAVKTDGTIIKTTDILWSNLALDDLITPNPFQQGDLICSGSGSCSIILSQPSNRMKGGEIYFLSFYKNSFAAKQGLTRYYLFNDKTLDTAGGQTTAYDHLFFCRSFKINNSTNVINGRVLPVSGSDLLYKSMKARESSSGIQTAIFTTKAINLVLQVKNTIDSYCISTPPVATVSMEDVTQTSFQINNLELRQCNQGSLMADIEVVRGIQDQYGVFTHLRYEKQKNVLLGIIGCDPSCLFCNGTTFKDCLVCSNTDQKLYFGSCYDSCPATVPYFMDNDIIIQRTLYNAHQCVSECPLGYYPDPQTKECLECNDDCQTCDSNFIGSCLTCEPIKYLFSGVCLEECPLPHHKSNFSSYTCDKISDTRFLKVKVQGLGYQKRVPKDIQQYLKVAISNEGGGQILSILWEQLEPSPENDDITIFTKTKEGDLQNREAIIKLKMTALNFMSTNQVVKLKVTVVNSLNEIAYDVYEFYQNTPPVQGTMSVSIVSGAVTTFNGTTVDSIFKIEVADWIDTYLHFELPTQYKAFMKIDSTYYTLTDQTDEETIYFRLPVLSKTESSMNVSLCISATDYHEGQSFLCQRLINIQNSLKYANDYNALINHLDNLTFNGNLSNVIYAANLLYFTMQTPKRLQSAPGICTIDYHCNYNGECSSQYGVQRCVCDMGYSGTFCQFRGSQMFNLQTIAQDIVDELYTYLQNKFVLRSNDIEVTGTILRGLLKDPDLVHDEQFKTIIDITEMIAGAPIYAHIPVNDDVRGIYLDALTNVLLKIFHSYSVNRATPQTQALAKGQSIFAQEVINTENFGRRILAANTQDYLIGGFSSKLAKSATSSNDILDGSLYQQWGRRVDKVINDYIDMFMPKLNPTTPKYTYTSNAFLLMAQSYYADQYKDKQFFIKEKDAYWYLPYEIFDNAQGFASDKHEVRLKAMKYIANPFLFESNPGGFVETNVTTLTFYDSKQDHISISLQNTETYVEIKEAYIKTQAFEKELMRCMAWDDSSHQFINDNSCSVQTIVENIPCLTCDENNPIITDVSLCRCKHLSRFAVVYQQTQPRKGKGVQIGLYSDFFAMKYWQDSFGFNAMIAASGCYAIGHVICYLLDRKKRPAMIEKLRERMRKLELKGFTQINNKPKTLTVKRDFDGKIIFIRHNLEEIKSDGQNDLNKELTPVQDMQKNPIGNSSKKKLLGQKKFKNDNDDVQEAELMPAKGKLSKKAQQKVKIQDKNSFIDDERMPTSGRSSPDVHNPKRKLIDEGETPLGLGLDQIDNNSVQNMNNDLFEQQMIKRYEEEKEINEFVRVHGTSSSEEDLGDKQRTKEQKRYLKIERKTKEVYMYYWKHLLINGNYVTSIMYVDSYLSPRHARWTMLYTCVLLNWFWAAVIYNNTKDPLALPDFVIQISLTHQRIKLQKIQLDQICGYLSYPQLEQLLQCMSLLDYTSFQTIESSNHIPLSILNKCCKFLKFKLIYLVLPLIKK